MNIAKYSVTVATLQGIAKKAKTITEKSELAKIKETRKELVSLRNKITKERLGFTAELRKKVNTVNGMGKELVAIIEPEELRLKSIEKKIEQEELRKERLALLPTRKAMLKNINAKMDEEEILSYSEKEFAIKYQELEDIFKENEKLKKAQERQKREMEKRIRADQEARREEEIFNDKLPGLKNQFNSLTEIKQLDNYSDKWEKEEDEKLERAKKDSFDASKAMLKNKIAEEEKRKVEEEERKKKNARYQKWLKENNFDEDTMILRSDDEKMKMYKLVATFNFKK